MERISKQRWKSLSGPTRRSARSWMRRALEWRRWRKQVRLNEALGLLQKQGARTDLRKSVPNVITQEEFAVKIFAITDLSILDSISFLSLHRILRSHCS